MTDRVELSDLKQDETDDAALIGRVRLRPAVDFGQQLETLRESGAGDLLDSLSEKGAPAWIERPVRLEGQTYLLRLSEAGQDDEASVIQLRLQSADTAADAPNERVVRQALELASRRFWWELDLEAVRAALDVNDYGQELLAHYWPLRPANMSGPWEGLLKTVVSVQIFPGLATRLQQALIDFYSGAPVMFGGRPYHLYPTVEQLAQIVPEDLLGLKFSRQKARYLPAIAEMILAQPDRFDWERLRNLPGPEAVAILDELPGVGVWTSHYVAMRGLPHLDVFIDEGGLRKQLATSFGRRPEMSAEEAAKLTEVYAPYRSIACYYTYMKMYAA